MEPKRNLRILLADDEEIVHQTLGDYLKDSGHEVDSAREGQTALKKAEECDFDLALIDVRMPGMDGLTLLEKLQEIRPELSVVIITGHGNMEMAIRALRLGAADFLTKPVKLMDLDAVIEKSLNIRALRQNQRKLKETIRGIQVSEDLRVRNRSMVGISSVMQEVQNQIKLAVDASCETILLTGETGSGKEVVAREIHFMNGTDETPFIAVSCPAIPDTLVESELFGHVKGAFTGATQDKAGYFELADGGTLFLDEIADLSMPAQAKLLRVLETRTVRRVGGTKEKNVNLRVIAATNELLEKLVKEKKFRKDLFFRLNVFSIQLPALRERREDILLLAKHFLSISSRKNRSAVSGFTEESKRLLLNYDFPGNVRELRNLVERATILCRSGKIKPEHLSLLTPSEGIISNKVQTYGDNERDILVKALEETKWNRRLAAKSLGMPYSTLRYKMKRLNVE